MTPERIDDPHDQAAQPYAAANPAGASRLQSLRPVRRVAELGSLGAAVGMLSQFRKALNRMKTSRAFRRALAQVQRGTPEAEVRKLLGAPDKIDGPDAE